MFHPFTILFLHLSLTSHMWSVMPPPPEVQWASAWACLPTRGQRRGAGEESGGRGSQDTNCKEHTITRFMHVKMDAKTLGNSLRAPKKPIGASGPAPHPHAPGWACLCPSQGGTAGQLALPSPLLHSVRMMIFQKKTFCVHCGKHALHSRLCARSFQVLLQTTY